MKKFFFLVFWLSLSVIFPSCASYRLNNKLAAGEKEFLSSVRYIISKEERNVFLSLPPVERKAFIEEFWKKRDPSPATEINEFKDEYYKRIDDANRLFKEGTTAGWLQDRGRVYILFGPPDQRETYPRGKDFYGPPMEIWHYGFYLLVFIDYYWTGNYELEPQSAQQVAEINTAQMLIRSRITPELSEAKGILDMDLKVLRAEEQETSLQVRIPIKNIWFEAEERSLKTTLELTLEVFDSSGKKVWEDKKVYPLNFTQENLKEIMDKNYLLKIPLNLEPGEYSLEAVLINFTDKSQIKKKIKFSTEDKFVFIKSLTEAYQRLRWRNFIYFEENQS